jgi:hypothetical protein
MSRDFLSSSKFAIYYYDCRTIEFEGLGLLQSTVSLISGLTGWTSVGHKTVEPPFNNGFLGTMNSTEGTDTQGQVTLLELYAKRNSGTMKSQFGTSILKLSIKLQQKLVCTQLF